MPKKYTISKEELELLVKIENIENKKSLKEIAIENGFTPDAFRRLIRNKNIEFKIYQDIIDMLGKQVGHLKIIGMGGNTSGGRKKWICQCVCGSIKEYQGRGLRVGDITSCGCKGLGKKGSIPRYWFSGVKRRAEIKGKLWDLDYDFLCQFFNNQCGKCAISGLDIKFSASKKEFEEKRTTTASIDRIDSSKGYTQNNIWFVHKDINNIKNDLDLNIFIDYCKIINDNYNKKIDNKEEIISDFAIHSLYKTCKYNAKIREIEFKISELDIKNKIKNQSCLCAISKIKLNLANNYLDIRKCNGTASIDRINSNLGYTIDNIWIVHKDINIMKQIYDMEYFLKLCNLVAKRNN